MRISRLAGAGLVAALSMGCCETSAPTAAPETIAAPEAPERDETPSCPPVEPAPAPDANRIERDEMFSLLAFAVAGKGFQERGSRSRGMNIAAVLVDPQDRPVCWARNATRITHNSAEHAEMRLLQNERGSLRWSRAHGHRLYTTLEPCVMCGGMILMHRVASVVYGEPARPSGGLFDRLSFDASSIGGPCPHPSVRGLDVRRAPGAFFDELEAADEYGLDDRAVFERAHERLLSFRPQHPDNDALHRGILEFLELVPDEYQALPYTVACPFAEDEPTGGRAR